MPQSVNPANQNPTKAGVAKQPGDTKSSPQAGKPDDQANADAEAVLDGYDEQDFTMFDWRTGRGWHRKPEHQGWYGEAVDFALSGRTSLTGTSAGESNHSLNSQEKAGSSTSYGPDAKCQTGSCNPSDVSTKQ